MSPKVPSLHYDKIIRALQRDAASGQQNQFSPEPTLVDRFFYSVDRFVPINMGVEDDLEPRQWWSEAYAFAHAIGWLLIALFLASWTGLVRKSSR